MNHPLCVMIPEIGVTSETFIRWDVRELAPGETAVIADPPPRGETIIGGPAWDCGDAPVLAFDPVAGDPPPEPDRLDAVRRFVREQGVEVVLIEFLDFADRWFDFLHTLGVRVVVRGHGVDVSARLREEHWQQAYLRYASADAIIVPSRAAAARLVNLGLPGPSVHVVRYCVDIPPLRAVTRSHPVDEEVRCVAVGRLVPKKAPLILLEAFRRAANVDKRLHLDVVGDGPLMPEARQFVEHHGLADRVRLHGRQPHTDTLLLTRHCDVLLHHAVTSPDDGDAEGQPLSILEAMAAGVPVVSTIHEGIPEVITDGLNGRLVAEGDAKAMAAALLDLAGSADERSRLARAARTTIEAEHSPEYARRMLRRVLELPPVRSGTVA